ncbi:hypothetical protein HanIR_Chr03g0109221 [Helianthus annuus]|nr:hypothetical protein HanIR_Chr03g0109221 [Helianthus annuus]
MISVLPDLYYCLGKIRFTRVLHPLIHLINKVEKVIITTLKFMLRRNITAMG